MKIKIYPVIKLGLSFLIPFIILLVFIPQFFTLELNTNSVLALALFAFIIFIAITAYRRVGHQGQLPLWLGGVLVIGAMIALVGSVGINGSPIFFELSARDQGFTLMGLIIGGIILVFGIKQSTSNAYWWGRGGRR